jgi:integrase/recombinase XerD
MLATCERRTFYGDRDRTLLLFLLDTGVRHAELCALRRWRCGHSNTGSVLVRSGKGRKPRVTFAGPKTRQALTRYLRHRRTMLADDAPLWATEQGTRVSYGGLRQVIRRRAARAGVPEPSLHSFRRGFAIASLRAGMDLVSLQRLLGHSDLSVIRRYLAQTEGDLQAAHERASPVDRLL